MVSCALLVLFAAGLHRHLRRRTPPDSVVPGVAAIGLVPGGVAQLIGAGLTTEFAFGLTDPDDVLVVPETAVFFDHWIGTIPWLWGGIGLTALAMSARRSQGRVRSLARLDQPRAGRLTTLFLVSPLQYMAGMTGPVWLSSSPSPAALRRRA